VRSKEYAKWVKLLLSELHPLSKDIRIFFNSYKPKTQEIHASLVIHNPDLYTIAKTISQRSGDVDNVFKPLADNIFIYGIDDSQIVRLSVAKVQSESWMIELSLEIKDR
jgi:Holliday junction resolvase RusA-like endonuclease